MNLHERNQALQEVEKYLETCSTKEQVDRGIAMVIEIEQKHIDYIVELMEEHAPDYIPVELNQ